MPSTKCQFCALNTFRENVWTNRQTNKQTNKQDKNNIVTGGTGDYNNVMFPRSMLGLYDYKKNVYH